MSLLARHSRPAVRHRREEAATTPPSVRQPVSLDAVVEAIEACGVAALVSASVDVASGAVRIELEAPSGTVERDAVSRRLGAALIGDAGVSRLSLIFLRHDGQVDAQVEAQFGSTLP